jgi:hypothetical protein
MLNRKELMQSVSLVMVDAGCSLADAQEQLSKLTTSELEQDYYRALAAGTINPNGTLKKSGPTPTVTQADVEAAQVKAAEELDELKMRLQAENAADLTMAAYERWKEKEPQRKAEQERRLKIAGQIFPLVCRAHNLSECEGNFRLLLDSDLLDSEYTATQAITSNAITGLVPASRDEAATFQQERIDQHNAALLSASPTELRQAVKSEAEQRRAQTALEAQSEADRAHQTRDAFRKYPPLPTERNGKPLDASFIKRADRTELRFLIQRYGESAVTARLRGQQ